MSNARYNAVLRKFKDATNAYTPLRKVIVFVPPGEGMNIYMAHVAAQVHYPPVRKHDSVISVSVSTHLEDAEAGKGRDVRIEHMRPYSDTLWLACEEWLARYEELANMYLTLKAGRIPVEIGGDGFTQPKLI